MKLAARYQAAGDILDHLVKSSTPADNVVHTYLKQHRYIGSHDRRFIRNIVYKIIRQYLQYQKILVPAFEDDFKKAPGRLLIICYIAHHKCDDISLIFTGEQYSPALLSSNEHALIHSVQHHPILEAIVLPSGFEDLTCLYSEDFLVALDQTAPLDIRVNTARIRREEVLQHLKTLNYTVENTPYAPTGLRLPAGSMLEHLPLYKQGLIEIQDEGSQLVSYLCPVEQCTTILDLCGGGGGKTLHLATLLMAQQQIITTDISPERLNRCRERLKRAQAFNVHCLSLSEAYQKHYDCIVVDAPCTGSGTWRRHPDLRNKLTVDLVKTRVQQQQEILGQAATLLHKNGYLLYITCSILPQENEEIIEKFLTDNPSFELIQPSAWPSKMILKQFAEGPYLKLSPMVSGTDGFFAALIRKK